MDQCFRVFSPLFYSEFVRLVSRHLPLIIDSLILPLIHRNVPNSDTADSNKGLSTVQKLTASETPIELENR